MLTYQELVEKKLSQLNQQHVGTVKGLEKAMHSQGIDPGESKRNGHHVDYPNARFRKSGKKAHNITSVDDGKGNLTSSTGGKQIRDAVLASGRVNKTPAAKAERAKTAAENKERKAKNRDPFTREHTEWWLDAFRLDERAFSPAGQAARAKMRNQNAQNLANKVNPRTGTSMKALPPARSVAPKTPTQAAMSSKPSPGGSLATRSSDKGGSLTRHKMQVDKDKQASKSQARQRLNSGSGGTPVTSNNVNSSNRAASRNAKSSLDLRKQATKDRRAAQKIDDAGAKDRIEKRKGGIGGGVKSALGGDVIGMRGKKGESGAEKEARQDMNKKNRADFAKKKVQQTGNLAKNVVGKTFSALTSQGKSGEDVQDGQEAGNVSGGSEYTSRTKRG